MTIASHALPLNGNSSGLVPSGRLARQQKSKRRTTPETGLSDGPPTRYARRRHAADWSSYTCEFLVMRVLRQQHEQIREDLSHLQHLAETAAIGDSAHRSHFETLQPALAALASELLTQMAGEEQIFPNLLELELAYVGEESACSCPTPVRKGLERIARRHSLHRRKIDQIRAEAACLIPSPDLTSIHRHLCDRLLQFCRSVVSHFELEDHVLLPRIARMEAAIFS
jgi:iron-sulfur cluster repair protein YtfE (RIC family)